MLIPLFKPAFGEEELEALRGPLETGWVGLGPKTKEFEVRFAQFVDAPYAVGVNSDTAALHLALKVLGIEPDDEVITTPMTFVSTNHAILYNGGVPVFADIEPDTLNLDASQIEPLITERTKAIIVVHYGGHPCDMDAVLDIAQRHNLKVIEDAAHACGAEYKGRRIGSIGNATCFSFHAVKNLATGDGGMITVHDSELDQRLRRLRWMGITKDTWSRTEPERGYSWYYWVEEVGFKCHMNDIAAAIGLVQLEKLEQTNARRRQIVQMYNEAFEALDWLETPVEKPYAYSAHHNYVVKLDRRDDFIAFLGERGIGTSVHYIPNHLYDIYTPYRRPLPVTEQVWKRIVSIPLFPDLLDEQVNYTIEAVIEFERVC